MTARTDPRLAAALFCLVATPHAFAGEVPGVATKNGFSVTQVTQGGPLTSVRGLAVRGGHVYASDASGALVLIESTTKATKTLVSGLPLSAPGDLLIGDGGPLTGERVVFADWNSIGTGPCCDGIVGTYDELTDETAILAQGNPVTASQGDPVGLALGGGGAFGDALYVMDFQGSSPEAPVLYTVAQDGTVSPFLQDPQQWTNARSPWDIEIDPNGTFGGDLFVADRATPPTIWRVSPGAALSPFLTGGPLTRITGLAFGKGGALGSNLWVIDSTTDATIVWEIRPGLQSTAFVVGLPGTTDFPDIAFSEDGDTLYIGVNDAVYALAPSVPLCADVDAISLSKGGTQTFTLTAGFPFAGDVYLLMGSASGDAPGKSLGPVHLNLNPDAYFFYTVENPNTPPLAGSFGLLDPFGKATAALIAPPGTDPGLAGTVLHHAYVVFDSVTLGPVFSSEAVSVTLQL